MLVAFCYCRDRVAQGLHSFFEVAMNDTNDPRWPLPRIDYHGRHNSRGHYVFNTSLDHLALCVHDAVLWKSAFVAAGDGTLNVDMMVVKALRKLLWLQTEQAIQQSLAGKLCPRALLVDPR